MENLTLNKIFRFFYPAQSSEEIRVKYGIPEKLNIHVEFAKDGYFVLTCKELPGLITEAKDGKELVRMFNDAVLTYYNVPKRVGDIVHQEMKIDGNGTFVLRENNKVLQEV